MDGYELAELLRNKLTIANAMQAADKLVELENKLKTGKNDESKSIGNEDKTSFFAQRKAVNNNGSKSNSSRAKSKSNFDEPVLPDESQVAD